MNVGSIRSIARVLNDAEVPFLVVGGRAVVAHGYGRLTHHLDIVIRLQATVIERAFEALATLGYRPRVPVTARGFGDTDQRSRWIEEKGMTVLNFSSDAHRDTPIDVFVSEPFDFETEYRMALVQDVDEGVPMHFARLPTLLQMKADAGRPQDLADIAELRLIHGES